MPNIHADFLVLDMKGVTLSARAAFYYVNSEKLVESEDPLQLYIVPATLALSWRINDGHTVSVRGQFTRIASDSAAGSEAELKVNEATLADNAQVHASWEWRLTQVCALLLALRYLPYQGDPIVQSTVQLDDSTTADVEATLDATSVQNAVTASVSGVFSWKHFNLRAGLAYGSVLFVPGPGLVVPLKYPYPEFGLYWRL